MGRWLPAILLFGLTTRCSCAEEPDNAYPGNTQNKALKAWMTQNRPDLLENYQEEGEYYVDVVSLGDLADSAILETESCVCTIRTAGPSSESDSADGRVSSACLSG